MRRHVDAEELLLPLETLFEAGRIRDRKLKYRLGVLGLAKQ